MAKVRCTQCGANNKLVDRCRLCGAMLPGAMERRQESGGEGTFSEIVEVEREAWRDYSEGLTTSAARSRRPAELPVLPGGAVELPTEKRRGWRRK